MEIACCSHTPNGKKKRQTCCIALAMGKLARRRTGGARTRTREIERRLSLYILTHVQKMVPIPMRFRKTEVSKKVVNIDNLFKKIVTISLCFFLWYFLGARFCLWFLMIFKWHFNVFFFCDLIFVRNVFVLFRKIYEIFFFLKKEHMFLLSFFF